MRAPRRQPQQGFTLLELMVVVVILGVLATFASLSIGNRVAEDKLETEAKRALAILNMVRDEAEMKGLEIGLRCHQGGYQIVAINQSQRWADYERDGPLRARSLSEPVALALEVEGRLVELPDAADAALLAAEVAALEDEDSASSQPQSDAQAAAKKTSQKSLEPQVLLLSSGETTPFVMEFTAPSVAEVFRLESKGLGELTLTRSVRNAGGA